MDVKGSIWNHLCIFKSVIRVFNRVPVAQWLKHCISSAKIVGSIPWEHIY